MYQFRSRSTVSKLKWGSKLQNFLVAELPTPNQTHPAIYTVWNESLVSQCLALFGFFPICNSISPIIDQCRYFFTSVIRPLWWFSLRDSMYLIQKESMDPSIFEVWNKNIFSFEAKMFFLRSWQMRLFILVNLFRVGFFIRSLPYGS